jgi:cystathionine beta-lyase
MNFNREIDRRHSECIKWNRFDEDVLPMWVADTDFRCPEEVIRALHARVDHGIFGYGAPPKELDRTVIQRLKRLYDWDVQENQIGYIPGIVTGFNAAIRAFCEPGEAVIYQTPAYPPFIGAPDSARLKGVQNPLLQHEDGTYHLDFDRFEQQIISENVRAFILCNPQNPTGRVFTREELTQLAEICLRQNVLIISDEIHCDILFDSHKHIPIASLSPEVAANTITFMAPSKTYNIAGLHASVCVIQNPSLMEKFHRFCEGLVGCPGVLALTAAHAAYAEGDDWLAEQNRYLQANRDFLDDALGTQLTGIHWNKPEATFLGWLDCSDLGLGEPPYEFFLREARVGLNDGISFGPQCGDFVRINFGTTRANLQEAVDRMQAALAAR